MFLSIKLNNLNLNLINVNEKLNFQTRGENFSFETREFCQKCKCWTYLMKKGDYSVHIPYWPYEILTNTLWRVCLIIQNEWLISIKVTIPKCLD